MFFFEKSQTKKKMRTKTTAKTATMTTGTVTRSEGGTSPQSGEGVTNV
jgi:hypothetical protein